MLKLRTAQAGDTIIEVLIVLAVLGLALGISYATANRSLQGARRAHEHTEALQLLQSQIEGLRYLQLAGTDIFGQTTPFCVDQNVDTAATKLHALPSSSCDVGIYHISDSYDATTQDTFTLVATWDDISSPSSDKVSLVYRLHKP